MIEAISCGGVVIFRGKILLLYKNIKNKYEGWVLPKGTVEPGETHEETALREVLEDFDFAILIQGRCMPTIWNDGRFEEHVRGAVVTVRNDDYCLPQICIEK